MSEDNEKYLKMHAEVGEDYINFKYRVEGCEVDGGTSHEEEGCSDWSDEDVEQMARDLLDWKPEDCEMVIQR